MTLRGEVTKQASLGDELAITIENVKRSAGGRLTNYGPPFVFRAPFSSGDFYRVGRIVKIKLTPQ